MTLRTCGVVWPVSGGVYLLPPLNGLETTTPYWCNSDGSVIVGSSGDNATSSTAVKWTDREISALASISDINLAYWCSEDAQIITGCNGNNNGNLCRWTSGGASGALLSLPAGMTDARVPNAFPRGHSASDDGSVIVGNCTNGGDYVYGAFWTNGTPARIADVPQPIGTGPGFLWSVSSDGSVIVGTDTAAEIAFRWNNNTVVPLGDITHSLIGTNTFMNSAAFCSNDATYIWTPSYGYAGIGTTIKVCCVIWTNDVGAFMDGDQDIHTGLWTAPAVPHITTTARSANLAFGSAVNPPPDNNIVFPVKWAGTAYTYMDTYASDDQHECSASSADGSIVAGWGRLIAEGATYHPLYWTSADNAVHLLPYPPYCTSAQAFGISSDGTMIFGQAYLESDGWQIRSG